MEGKLGRKSRRRMENVGEEKLSYKKKKWQEWKDELIEEKK